MFHAYIVFKTRTNDICFVWETIILFSIRLSLLSCLPDGCFDLNILWTFHRHTFAVFFFIQLITIRFSILHSIHFMTSPMLHLKTWILFAYTFLRRTFYCQTLCNQCFVQLYFFIVWFFTTGLPTKRLFAVTILTFQLFTVKLLTIGLTL